MTTTSHGHDHEIVLHGLGLHYLEWGDPAGTPVVLLHGLATEAHMWDTVARALVLQDRYRVLVPDLRGHGQSDWAPDYAVERWGEDLHAFVGALAVPPYSWSASPWAVPSPGATPPSIRRWSSGW
jgi:pimeloyl-ACP methyl ester carboxylesterase